MSEERKMKTFARFTSTHYFQRRNNHPIRIIISIRYFDVTIHFSFVATRYEKSFEGSKVETEAGRPSIESFKEILPSQRRSIANARGMENLGSESRNSRYPVTVPCSILLSLSLCLVQSLFSIRFEDVHPAYLAQLVS